MQVDRIEKDRGNIAGVEVPVFKELVFKPIEYDLRYYPLWVDRAIFSLRDIAKFDALVRTLEERIELLSAEKGEYQGDRNLSPGSADCCGCARQDSQEEAGKGRLI